ncbi:MAG: hypothetical protein KAH20_15405 [Methylococcales bacterium]|nr:hypothetical protein [Methylococcales bacterium]
MLNLLITIVIIFTLLLAWVLIQQAARKYAANHPELGPVKEEGLGCGKTCGCKKGSCSKES